MNCEQKPSVLITGFGPFRNYSVNSSWEAVKLVNVDKVNLIKKEIPVVYEFVDKTVPQMWQQYKPMLVIHCGVSKLTNNLKLETRAHSGDYCGADINGCVPADAHKDKKHDKCNCLTTEIDIEKVCEKVKLRFKSGELKMDAEPSTNAGRYLCEYIYYTSLKEDPRRTIFIHVPELSDRCSASDIAKAIECTIEAILELILECGNKGRMHCQ